MDGRISAVRPEGFIVPRPDFRRCEITYTEQMGRRTTSATAERLLRMDGFDAVACALDKRDGPSAKRVLIPAISQLMSDDTALHEIADDSYRHDNGFDKIVLAKFPDGRQLRLHVWSTRPNLAFGDTKGNLHNHRWSFVSMVISGALYFEKFDIDSECGTRFDLYEYARTPSGYGLMLRGERKVRILETGTWEPGMIYDLNEHVVHRTWAEARPTVTLVLQNPATKLYAQVLMPRQQLPSTNTLNLVAMTVEDLRTDLALAIVC